MNDFEIHKDKYGARDLMLKDSEVPVLTHSDIFGYEKEPVIQELLDLGFKIISVIPFHVKFKLGDISFYISFGYNFPIGRFSMDTPENTNFIIKNIDKFRKTHFKYSINYSDLK